MNQAQRIEAPVVITELLDRRTSDAPDYLAEKLALQDLARHMADKPSEVLPRLVNLAMEVCGAESAGISILEPEAERFRWFGLHGVLSVFSGATTPRHDSPCGVCLDEDDAVLMDTPERIYSWIRDANIVVPEVLLVPLRVAGGAAIGTLWIVAQKSDHFDRRHARVMSELATFAGIALQMIQAEERAHAALEQQELLTQEMSHRVKNLFALVDSMIRLSARGATTKDELAKSLSARIHTLSAANSLVRRNFSEDAPEGVSFGELIQRVLQPHDHAHSTVEGPEVAVGQHAVNTIALVFHEMATNASKYGALKDAEGSVAVSWTTEGDDIKLKWKEAGGPLVNPPAKQGFGTSLIASTINRIGGTIAYDWRPDGLVADVRLPLKALTL